MRDQAAADARGGEKLLTASRRGRWGAWILLALAAVASAGCREDAAQAEATHQGARIPPPHAEALPGSLAACPCLVEVATTEVGEIPGGMLVTVRAEGTNAEEEIRARARLLARIAGAGDRAPDPCPVVAQRTLLLPQEIPGGVSVLVFPREVGDLEWLRAETSARVRGLAALHAPAR